MSHIIISSQSKNGSGVLVKFNNWVGNCQRNSCAKKCKNLNNYKKTYDEKATGLFFVDTVLSINNHKANDNVHVATG